MSEDNYLTPVNNHFDNDDIDDDTFLANSRRPNTNPFEDEEQMFEEKRKEIESRTLEASKRSLGLLYETEEVGKATAVELSKQREQLEKTSRQLDEINSTLRTSQRHLNGLKSIFGGLKNYLSGNRDNMSPRPPPSPNGSKIEEEYATSSPMSPDEVFINHPINRIRSDGAMAQVQQQENNVGFDHKLESNLADMCTSLDRLKGLATDMRGEIETQNELLDNMNYKIEDVDLKMSKQNKEMNKLLGKK